MTGSRPSMRLGVLDVGSNTVNLVVAEAGSGLPLPVHTWERRPRLAHRLPADGTIGPDALKRMITAVDEAVAESRRAGVNRMFAYTTAVVRDAPNREDVLTEVEKATGLRLGTLSGIEDARMTFLAARRWLGWQAGPMLMVDIGGGCLEVAFGRDRLPESAVSLPLGAGRLTREFLADGDPPSPRAVRRLRRHVREQFAEVAARTSWESPRTSVAASKTFQQLARLTGAPPLRLGPFVPRVLRASALRPWMKRLAAMPSPKRSALPGVSPHRARQILAGSIVAYEVMRRLSVDSLIICPWGLREGILLRELESQQPPLVNAAWVPWN
ncbi:Ppx/GppA phosphatase family protein [Actinoplanes sp. NEAU-A12]|uniref:Ppx/GppA phosphatase family protein n=1 Tax=Actinoplanes sandaracinus TaxID=3045177 RepID=A0ABT6WS05_9ACTN|nr:Ppx/GppA phosphatase family protein [Actinoplanes sandaracinus]MDI6102518.1 Ppx/GppA phosphatase family protein [Actinoplanes sandaracinus]